MKNIPNRPALLLALMDSLVSGYEKYQAELGSGSAEMLTLLATERDNLRAALVGRTEAAGAAERATQELYRERDEAVLTSRKGRDFAYAQLGKHDARLVEFGLDSLRRRNGNGSGNGTTEPDGSGTETPPDDGGNENGDNSQP